MFEKCSGNFFTLGILIEKDLFIYNNFSSLHIHSILIWIRISLNPYLLHLKGESPTVMFLEIYLKSLLLITLFYSSINNIQGTKYKISSVISESFEIYFGVTFYVLVLLIEVSMLLTNNPIS